MSMEININCDLGEKSKHHSNKHDPDLLEIVNSANVACGYHAGDEETMNQVVEISKKNGVSIGAHPSFNDPENFGRERINLSSSEIRKLIIDQYEILQNIAVKHGEKVTHIKPHGALNNMACEDIELSTILAKSIKEICKVLEKEYAGVVPDKLEELLKLKGVGRKTANLTLIAGHNKPGICVDIHVHRISNRWGYLKTETPDETEMVLRKILPRRFWKSYNELLVSFGQNLCKPISPFCTACPLETQCLKIGVKRHR